MLRFIVVTAVMAVHADVPDAAGHRLLASDWARAAASSNNTTTSTTTPTAAASDRRLDAVLPGVLYYTENYYADSRCTQLYFARTFVTNTCYYSGLGSVASTPTQTVYDYIQNTVTAVGNNDGYILRQAAFRDAACIVPDTSTGSPPYYAQTPITNTFAAVPRQCQVGPRDSPPPSFQRVCAQWVTLFPCPPRRPRTRAGRFPTCSYKGASPIRRRRRRAASRFLDTAPRRAPAGASSLRACLSCASTQVLWTTLPPPAFPPRPHTMNRCYFDVISRPHDTL